MARPNVVAPLVAHPHSDWNRLRIAARLSLRELSAASGMNAGTLSLIDSGRLHPTPLQSARILAVLRPEHPGAQLPPKFAEGQQLVGVEPGWFENLQDRVQALGEQRAKALHSLHHDGWHNERADAACSECRADAADAADTDSEAFASIADGPYVGDHDHV